MTNCFLAKVDYRGLSVTYSSTLPAPVFPLGTIVATLVPILAFLVYFLFRSGFLTIRHKPTYQ